MKSITLKSWLLAESCAITFETRLHYDKEGFGTFNNCAQFYCYFKQVDKQKHLSAYDDCTERSIVGNGNTPEEAIKDLINDLNHYLHKQYQIGYDYLGYRVRFTPQRINKGSL